MKIVESSTPSGHTIFCEDIRQEFNGKLIFIGVYHGMMFLGTLPARIRLALRIIYQERPGESDEPVLIKIFGPVTGEGETEILSANMDPNFRNAQNVLPAAPDSTIFLTAMLIAQLEIELKSEGRIKVRAYRGDSEIRLGSLAVKLLQTPPAP